MRVDQPQVVDEILFLRRRRAAATAAATLRAVGLPTTYDGTPFEELLATMRVDKKSRGSQLRFVVLDGLAKPVVLAGPSEEQLRAAYEHLGGAS